MVGTWSGLLGAAAATLADTDAVLLTAAVPWPLHSAALRSRKLGKNPIFYKFKETVLIW